MFEHKNAALDGFYPGLVQHQPISNLGVYQSEVIIIPVYEDSEDGNYFNLKKKKKKKNPKYYIVVIRVFFNGKRYEEQRLVDEKEARVIAKLHGISFKQRPLVSINGVQVLNQKQVEILVKNIQSGTKDDHKN